MKILRLVSATIFCYLLFSVNVQATVIFVSSQQEFNSAHNSAAANDSIIWRQGTYSDIFMNITKDRLFIAAENLGGTIFTGSSRVDIRGDFITLEGFQFLDGNIGTNDVINTRGSYNVFTPVSYTHLTLPTILLV